MSIPSFAVEPNSDSAVRTSEERFALAMQGANDGLWDRNFLTGEVYYSPRWKSMLGYAEHEVDHTIEAFERLVHPGDRLRRQEAIAAYMSGAAERYETELRIRHKDGHYIRVLTRAIASRDASGRVVRMVGTHVDVTEQRRAKQRMAAQYAATRVLADSTTLKETVPKFLQAVCEPAEWDLGGVLIIEPGGQRLNALTHWRLSSIKSGEWETAFQRRSYKLGEGLPGEVASSAEPVWISRADQCPEFPSEALAAGMNSLCITPLFVAERVVAVLEFYGRDIRPRDGEWLSMLESLNTQVEQGLRRRKMEKDLADAERKYHEIVEQSLHGIYQTTPDGRILSANPAFARALGYDDLEHMESFQGLLAEPLYVDLDRRAAFKEHIEAQGSVLGFEARMRRKNGAVIWASIDARVVRDDAGNVKYYEGVLTDITDRKEAERLKADFVSFVTHQLRTPLTGIKWLLELAQGGELSEETASYVHDARASADRLITLVNDLLDVSRLESGRLATSPEATDLALVTSNVVAELAPLAQEKHQNVVMESAAGVPAVFVDPKLAREVVLNLISNALRYTPERGAVTVRMGAKNGAVEWEVRDTGIGIPASALPRLFEKFYRAENAAVVHTEGTGLGLYLVRLIVERSGGRVWCESTEGAGSTFHFTLPLAR